MPDSNVRSPVTADRARIAVLACWASLFLVSIHAIVVEASGPVVTIALALTLLGPLAVAMPGLLRARRRTYAWATLCLAPHVCFGLTELVASPAMRTSALALLGLAVVASASLVAYLRLTRARSRT